MNLSILISQAQDFQDYVWSYYLKNKESTFFSLVNVGIYFL